MPSDVAVRPGMLRRGDRDQVHALFPQREHGIRGPAGRAVLRRGDLGGDDEFAGGPAGQPGRPAPAPRARARRPARWQARLPTARGGAARRPASCATAAPICAGVVPQHPPTSAAPASANRRRYRAK